MYPRKQTLRRTVTACWIVGLLPACSGEFEQQPIAEDVGFDEPEATGTVEDELAAITGPLWDQNNSVVNVCWTNTGFASEKGRIKTALESTWQANSGLHFNFPANPGTDVCPRSPPGSTTIAPQYMPIYIANSTGWWGNCQMGYGA